MSKSTLETEALRINERYLVEVVEQFNLCPWAKPIRNTPALVRHVIVGSQDTPDLRATAAAWVEDFQAGPGDIGLLIFPTLTITPRLFRTLVGALETEHASKHPRHDVPVAMASFHPVADADLGSPARLVSFLRRSPDPTIQLVRRSAMSKAREGEGSGSTFAESLDAFLPLMGAEAKLSVSDRIAKTNLETVERVGVAAIEAILAEIAEDRARSYAEAHLGAGP